MNTVHLAGSVQRDRTVAIDVSVAEHLCIYVAVVIMNLVGGNRHNDSAIY